MPTLTAKSLQRIASDFKGLVTLKHEAHAEFSDQSPVLIPDTVEDVARAVQLASAAGRKIFVRSGQSIAKDDLPKRGTEDFQAAVISMEALRTIEYADPKIAVGASVTMADLAKALQGRDWFLPLSDNPTQSVASAVLSLADTPFHRSQIVEGSLRDFVVEAEVVPLDGPAARKPKTLRKKDLHELWTGDRKVVIAKLTFDCSASQSKEVDRWTTVWMTQYKARTFRALCDALMGNSFVPEKVDLGIRVTSASYGMKLVVIRATGHGEADQKMVSTAINAQLAKLQMQNLGVKSVTGPGKSLAAWVGAGPCIASPEQVVRRFGSNFIPKPFEKIRDKFIEGVDFAIGEAKSGRDRAVGVQAWAELNLTESGKVVVRAELLDDAAESDVAKLANKLFASAIPADKVTESVSNLAKVYRAPERQLTRGIEDLSILPTIDFDILPNLFHQRVIPNFKGFVFQASDGRKYERAISQYATSSYSSQVVAERMTPRYVAQPLDSDDVVIAVNFAAANNLKVVTRSGGHQYCGLSSGGSDTLLLDMKRIDSVQFAFAAGRPSSVTVGPGIALRDLSRELRKNRVVIPHGECPLVRIGGHVQTGGIGHQLRSLGATLDYVRSFKMVTRDPDNPGSAVYAEHEFTKPATGDNSLHSELFRAVLGGSPGSWGVLTEITFDLVLDETYEQSVGYSKTYLYDPELNGDDVLNAAMNQFQSWAERQASGDLPEGVDFFLSVVSDDFLQLRPKVVLVEMMSRDKAGAKEIKSVVDTIDASTSIVGSVVSALASPIQGPASLSLIADNGVRDIGLLGLPSSGREFDLPYKKSLHISKVPFNAEFCRAFVELVHLAMIDSDLGIKLVVQAVIGGGKFVSNKANNASYLQRRDAVVQLVFDTFYESGSESLALSLQRRMKSLLPQFSQGQDIRMTWGTFEDSGSNGKQIEMKLPEVQQLYFDSTQDYAALKQIKSAIDPADLFHTPFTIQ